MQKILITGTNGFVGLRAAEFLKTNYKVFAATRNDFDITDSVKVDNFIVDFHPDIVLHSAAISKIDVAEQNPELSDKVNRLSPYYIAKACKKIGAKFINCSSDQIYSGNTERFALNESIAVDPQNLYAKQKLAAEKLVQEILPSTVSLRLTWMYDTPSSPLFQHKALPLLLKEAAETNTPLKVNTNQMRSVTYIKNIVENLPYCAELPGGVYNYGSENDVPIIEFYKHAAQVMGYSEGIIEPFEGNMQNILIDNTKIRAHGINFPTAKNGFTQAFSG